MKLLIFTVLLFTTLTAAAHFEIGTYKGVTTKGASCSVEIKSVYFVNDLKHPLAERVEMSADIGEDKELLTTSHLPLVDTVAGTARPKKEILTAVVPFSSGAKVYELIMNEDGPSQFVYFLDNYKNPSLNTREVCLNLSYQAVR